MIAFTYAVYKDCHESLSTVKFGILIRDNA
jgi:hypothetical protein